MRLPLKVSPCLIVLFVAGLAIGCSGLSQPYPAKTLHSVQFDQPSSSTAPPIKAALRVDRVQVAEPYDQPSFVYQTGPTRVTTDYYNCFAAAPGRLLTGQLDVWMSKAGLFSTAVSGDSSVNCQYSLETHVTGLYGQYEPNQTPQAVVEVRFLLIDNSKGDFVVAFDKRYRNTQPLKASPQTPEELVSGWNAAWNQILADLSADLRNSPSINKQMSARGGNGVD